MLGSANRTNDPYSCVITKLMISLNAMQMAFSKCIYVVLKRRQSMDSFLQTIYLNSSSEFPRTCMSIHIRFKDTHDLNMTILIATKRSE
jgi:hypothetical protein